MQVNVLVVFDIVDDPEEVGEEVFVPAVVKAFDVAFDLWQFHEVDDDLTGFQYFFLYGLSVHADDAGQHGVGHKCFVVHDFGGVESGEDVDEEFGGSEEVADDEFVDAFVDFESVFALPVTALFEETMALIDVVLDFVDGVELEVDFDEEEGDVHFFPDFDGFFEGEVVGLDGLIVVGVGGVDLCFIEEGITDLGFAEVLLCVFDLGVGVVDELLEGFLDLHGFKLFLNYTFDIVYNWMGDSC
jgi:hypothetical protein